MKLRTVRSFHVFAKKDENPIQWKHGDVIGCSYNVKKRTIEYSINGESLGVAFEIEQKEEKQLLHLVLSLNQTEIVELNTGPDFQYAHKKLVGVSSVVGNDDASENDTSENEKEEARLVVVCDLPSCAVVDVTKIVLQGTSTF